MSSSNHYIQFKFEGNTNLHDGKKYDLIKHIKTEWDMLHETTVFRYNVKNVKEKYINIYFIQLNPERKLKRRTPEEITEICQHFDPSKFNFTKVSQSEVILRFFESKEPEETHTILVNVSPINKYHSLLCPSIDKKLPQIVTLDSLRVVLEFYHLARDRDLQIGYNSLCALASVNHLHYHLFVNTQTLPVETANCKNIAGPLWVTDNYPIPAFCFETSSQNTQVENIYRLIEYLISNSIAHNVFITRGRSLCSEEESARVLIWPRKSIVGVKQFSSFNVAVCELSGWFPVYVEEDYENLQVECLENELCKWKVDNFDHLSHELEMLFR